MPAPKTISAKTPINKSLYDDAMPEMTGDMEP
jgi:hypothetical protein